MSEKNKLHETGNELVKSLDKLFKKAPHLPANARDVLVTIAPWLALIFGILGIIAGVSAIGLSPMALFGGVDAGMFVLISGVLTIVSSVLMLMAYPKLAKRHYSGWMLLFWSELVSVIPAVFALSVGSVLGILIGFYLLFEIKGHYK